MVLVSYFSVLIGLSFSHIGYYLNVFDGLWKIGRRLTGLNFGYMTSACLLASGNCRGSRRHVGGFSGES